MRILKKILYICLIPLIMVTKVIEFPLTINFSPADILMIFVGSLLILDFIKDTKWRCEMLKNKVVKVFLLLILVRGLSSLISQFWNVEHLTAIGAFVANAKFIMSFMYFLAGVKIVEILGRKVTLVALYVSIYLFLLVGLASTFYFHLEWTGLDRMVSLANDPNVAGLICLLGVLIGYDLVLGARNKFTKMLLIVSLLPFGLGIVMTGSRTALGAAFVLILGLLYGYRQTPKKLVLIIMSLLIVFNLALFIETSLFNSKNINALVTRVYYHMEDARDYRYKLSRVATEMGNDYWLTGVGTGQFLVNSSRYYHELGLTPGDENLVTHNTFLSFYAENGILGFIGYSLLLGLYFKSRKNNIVRVFTVLLILFSLFFNIENIRLVWLVFGVYLYQKDVQKVHDIQTKWSIVGSFAVLGSLVALIFLPPVFVPFNPNNQSIDVKVENDLEIYMDFSNHNRSTLLITIEGDQNEVLEVKNERGFYYNRLEMKPGQYKIRFKVIGEDIMVSNMYIKGSRAGNVQKNPWQKNAKIVKDSKRTVLSLIPMAFEQYEESTQACQEDIVFGNDLKGLNYGNQIRLLSSSLKSDGVNKYTYKLEFEKIGEIDVNYIFLFRGYPTSVKHFGEIDELAFDYVFKQSLIDMAIGERFTTEWSFDTLGEAYALYTGFYYYDEKINRAIQPLPRAVFHGFVQ